MPDVTHFYLDSAYKKLNDLGVSDDRISDTTMGENSVVVDRSNWIVLTQTPAAGQTLAPGELVHLGVVKVSDPKASGITPQR
jgi:beta-lactam-binding protein with PASTA domain